MILTKNIQSGLSVYDYSNILLGGFDNIIQGIVKLNSDLVNLNADFSDFITAELLYNDDFYVSKSPQVQLPTNQANTTTQQIKGFESQSIYDLNLMGYSGFDNIVNFLKDNNINSLNNQSVQGIVANFNANLNINLSLNSIINNKGYIFVTGVFKNVMTNFILRQDGFYLLRQDGGRFIRQTNA